MTREASFENRLSSILLANDWFRRVIDAVASVDPPNWAVAAGVIRDLVWDHLHGYDNPAAVKDVDVPFFDSLDLTPERDDEVEARLRKRLPGVEWDAKNQAAVHLWYERVFHHSIDPITSIEDGVGRFPETATAIAVRLTARGRLDIVAPYGLDDLFAMVLRRNKRQVTREYFRQRLARTNVRERWPHVTVIDD